MWAMIGKWLAQKFVAAEIEKLSGNQKTLAEKAFSDFVAGHNLKKEVYDFLDKTLAEGQTVEAEKSGEWFTKTRADLKTWLGQ